MALAKALSSNSVVWKRKKKLFYQGILTDKKKNSWWIGQQAMEKLCEGVLHVRQETTMFKSGTLPLKMYQASDSFSPNAVDEQSVPSATRAMTSV